MATKRKPRKKGQRRNSPNHSDLYTDENPKGTIKGLKFATVKDAEASVNKIKKSGKSHAHKIQAAIAMEQRAKVMGKKSAAAVYRKFINSQKKDESIMRVTENQLREMIRGKLLKESMHPLDAQVAELDHNYGKSDVYSYLYRALQKLAGMGDEAAMDAMEEFEMAENYGDDDPENLLSILDMMGLKDKVLANM